MTKGFLLGGGRGAAPISSRSAKRGDHRAIGASPIGSVWLYKSVREVSIRLSKKVVVKGICTCPQGVSCVVIQVEPEPRPGDGGHRLLLGVALPVDQREQSRRIRGGHGVRQSACTVEINGGRDRD